MKKRLISSVLVLVMVLGVAGFAAAAQKLVIYTSMKESLIGQLRDAFLKMHPGIEMDYQSAGAS
jgi:iron(III) transport system substrate-binding protein